MKTKNVLFILLLVVSVAAHAQSNKKIELPPVVHSNTTTLEIRSVTLSEDATVLEIDAFFTPRWWIKIASDSYLQADGQKYMIRSGQGIDLDSLFWMPESGEASFNLTFDPLPLNTKTFDFIESDCDDCFKLWGVDLVNSHFEIPEMTESYTPDDDQEASVAVNWKKGKAAITGQLIGYTPQIEIEPRVVYLNPITSKSNSVPLTLSEDGSFSAEIEMYNASQVMITYSAPQNELFWFIAAPGEKTHVLINLPEANRQRTKLRSDYPDYGKKIRFSGFAAKLNEELHSGALSETLFPVNSRDDMLRDIAGITLEDFSNYILEKYRNAVENNNRQNVSSQAKEIANMRLTFDVNSYLMNSDAYLIQAFMHANQVSWEEAAQSIRKLEKYEHMNDYLTALLYRDFDEDVLLIRGLSDHIGQFGYVMDQTNGRVDYFKFLINSEKVKQEDKDALSDYIKGREDEMLMPEGEISAILRSYSALQDEYLESNVGVGYLSKLWGTQDCFLLDLVKCNQISRKMEDYYPLTDGQKESLEKMNPVIRNVLLEENQLLLTKIEENKKKTGYKVLETPDVAHEDLFAEMIKPFEGKVVLVDIWATWCGPCRAANIAMEPIKAQFADRDLVYLYLAGEDSPFNTWENMITDLHGYHHRIDDAGWNYLREELNARGVPTYLIIDKEGNQSYHTVGFPGSDTIKKELTKQLDK